MNDLNTTTIAADEASTQAVRLCVECAHHEEIPYAPDLHYCLASGKLDVVTGKRERAFCHAMRADGNALCGPTGESFIRASGNTARGAHATNTPAIWPITHWLARLNLRSDTSHRQKKGNAA